LGNLKGGCPAPYAGQTPRQKTWVFFDMATILVADDDNDIREMVRFALEKSGHRILEAETGAQTLELLQKAPVDLLILDVMMPGMDGHEVQLQMSKDEKLQKIPVVVISAMQVTRNMFLKFPQVRKFVPKPFDPFDLSKIIDEIVNKNKP